MKNKIKLIIMEELDLKPSEYWSWKHDAIIKIAERAYDEWKGSSYISTSPTTPTDTFTNIRWDFYTSHNT